MREGRRSGDRKRDGRKTFREVMKSGLAVTSFVQALPTAAVDEVIVVEGVDDGVGLTEGHRDLSGELIGGKVEGDQARPTHQVRVVLRDGSREVVVIEREVEELREESWRGGEGACERVVVEIQSC